MALKKAVIPLAQLEKSVLMNRGGASLSAALKTSATGIIAEHKRRSPSKDSINQNTNVAQVAKGYRDAGVCGMSVLTDIKYFGGCIEDLILARGAVDLPLLRKEFIIDTYQIVEAKAYGADVILLIAAILEKKEIETLSALAKKLGMDVLLEVHDGEELKKSLVDTVDLLGVNNRNLKNFTVDLETSKALSSKIPDDFVKVSESGISTPEAIRMLKGYGYQGFLMGEHFMATDDPGSSATGFINKL